MKRSYLVHDEDEQGQQQESGQDSKRYDPARDGGGLVSQPEHRDVQLTDG